MNGRICFAPHDVETIISSGDTVLDAALSAGVPIEHECGGNCACTTCQVQIITGMQFLSAMEAVECARLLDAELNNAHSRLACQAIFNSTEVGAYVLAQPIHAAADANID